MTWYGQMWSTIYLAIAIGVHCVDPRSPDCNDEHNASEDEHGQVIKKDHLTHVNSNRWILGISVISRV